MPPTPSPDAPPKVAVPTLNRPARPSPDRPPPTPTPDPLQSQGPQDHLVSPSPGGAWAGAAGVPPGPSPNGPTPTTSSWGTDDGPSASRTPKAPVTQAQVAKVLARIVSTIAGAVGWVAGRRGWTLREPDADELAEISDPVARILHRHVPMDWLSEDLIDGVLFTEAVVSYVKTDPLTRDDEDDYDQDAAAAAATDDLTPGHQETR